jgi:hypothetical protein
MSVTVGFAAGRCSAFCWLALSQCALHLMGMHWEKGILTPTAGHQPMMASGRTGQSSPVVAAIEGVSAGGEPKPLVRSSSGSPLFLCCQP